MNTFLGGFDDGIPLSRPLRRAAAGVTAFALVVVFTFGSHPVFARGLAQTVHAPAVGELPEAATDARQWTEAERREILWLARAVYSETKRPEEQFVIAWVIRNRVESEKFPETYEAVVRQRGQFSGLNPGDRQYGVNVSLDWSDTGPGWDSARRIAETVYAAEGSARPVDVFVRHFYSPDAVRATPEWAQGAALVHTLRDADTGGVRFAFYAGVR